MIAALIRACGVPENAGGVLAEEIDVRVPVEIVESRTFAARDGERKRAEIHVGARVAAGKMRLRGAMAREALRIGCGEALLGFAERLLHGRVPTLSNRGHCPTATQE